MISGYEKHNLEKENFKQETGIYLGSYILATCLVFYFVETGIYLGRYILATCLVFYFVEI